MLYLAHVAEFLSENFSTMGYSCFYLTFYLLLHQVPIKLSTVATIPNTVHYSKTFNNFLQPTVVIFTSHTWLNNIWCFWFKSYGLKSPD